MLSAQENPARRKELGISFSNFDGGFGAFHRLGKPNALWRFNSGFGTIGNQNSSQDGDDYATTKSFAISLSIGREFRKPISERFEGRLGFDVSSYYNRSRQEGNKNIPGNKVTQTTTSYSPGANAVFGVNFVIKESIVIGAELRPGLTYSTTKINVDDESSPDTTTKYSGFNFSFSNTALLSIAYRF